MWPWSKEVTVKCNRGGGDRSYVIEQNNAPKKKKTSTKLSEMFTSLPWGYHSVLPLAHMNGSSVDKLSPWGGASGNKSLNTDKELTLLKTSGLSNLPITRF